MVRVLRVSSMPCGVLMWVRPVHDGYVMYVTDAVLGAGIVPPWKIEQGSAKVP